MNGNDLSIVMTDINVFSVYEVSLHLKQVVETQIEPMYVSGEVSNFVHHSSGHMYFNLKDENATLRCTFFKGQNYGLNFKVKDGMQVVCFGKLTVFEKGGSYNLNVRNMSLSGVGNLQQQFDILKKKLHDEGLFDPVHKQPLPRFPRKIGIITSPTGAAIQDLTNILQRRFPVLVDVYPAVVQGNDAPPQVVSGLEYFNREKSVDVIIVTRGGGSQEDLFCFNHESIARAIFHSRIPVISAIGHEIDFTISDFVADLRAPTPSAAAELVVPDKKDILGYLDSMQRRFALVLENVISKKNTQVITVAQSLAKYHPEKVWQSYQQRFDMATMQLAGFPKILEHKKQVFANTNQRILALFETKMTHLSYKLKGEMIQLGFSLKQNQEQRLKSTTSGFEQTAVKFEQLSPLSIMAKGYAVIQQNGIVVKSVNNLKVKDSLSVHFQDGSVSSTINSIEHRNDNDL